MSNDALRPATGTATPTPVPTRSRRSYPWRDALITAAAIALAFLLGAVLMVLSDPAVMNRWSYFFSRPGDALGASWDKVTGAYGALLNGSVGSLSALSDTTAEAAPLIAAGLGVGLAFRAGLFNIGAQGQATMGAIVAAYVGFSWHLPYGLHLLVALTLGIMSGAVWAGIAGWLKARAGAHEVIVTIMLNYLATAGLLPFLLKQGAFLRPGSREPKSPVIDWNAVMPRIDGTRLHLGFLLALLAAAAVWWLLERSTTGFRIRAVGANPDAARTAGMSVPNTTTLTMLFAGGLAGLAGTMATLAPTMGGFPSPLSANIVGSVGFDAITVALLGRSKPLGTILAGLLFGAMKAGGLAMQSMAQTPLELTTVLQALIVMFVAAPRLVETILPFLRARTARRTAVLKGAAA